MKKWRQIKYVWQMQKQPKQNEIHKQVFTGSIMTVREASISSKLICWSPASAWRLTIWETGGMYQMHMTDVFEIDAGHVKKWTCSAIKLLKRSILTYCFWPQQTWRFSGRWFVCVGRQQSSSNLCDCPSRWRLRSTGSHSDPLILSRPARCAVDLWCFTKIQKKN